MKNKTITLLMLSLGLVACNSGGSSTSNSITPPTPKPSPIKLTESLPYTYTTDYSTGESINNLPVVDLLPFGSYATVTITVTNPYKESSIFFFTGSSNRLTTSPTPTGVKPNTLEPTYAFPISDAEIYPVQRSHLIENSCFSYTRQNQLPPQASCNFEYEIDGAYNWGNTELIFAYFEFDYAMDDPNAVDDKGISIINGRAQKKQYIAVNIKSGITYNYPEIKSTDWFTFNVLHESDGNDYIYPLIRTSEGYILDKNQTGKIKVNFDESGVALIDAKNTESCTLVGCVNGVIPKDGYNIQPSWNSTTNSNSGQLVIGKGTWSYTDNKNYALRSLDNINIGRGCSNYYGTCPENLLSGLIAVQPDGTLVGQRRAESIEFGCVNRDGSNYRPLKIPKNVAIDNTFANNTITYGNDNWVLGDRTFESSERTFDTSSAKFNYYHVKADKSGNCEVESNNRLTYLETIVTRDQQMQITPSGVYGGIGWNGDRTLKFYKYLPREYNNKTKN